MMALPAARSDSRLGLNGLSLKLFVRCKKLPSLPNDRRRRGGSFLSSEPAPVSPPPVPPPLIPRWSSTAAPSPGGEVATESVAVLVEAGAERLRWLFDFLEGVELAEAVEE